jgi:flagellar biosynthesis protein FlhB
MSGQTHQPPTRSRRARLAARGILPYEPSAVYAAAFCGILLVLASGGDGWFEDWKMLLRQASEQPGDLSALATSGRRLLLHSVGSLVGVSLLCGWGVGWMQRRLSPPAATRWDGPLPSCDMAAPHWFAGLLAMAAMLSLGGVTLLLSTSFSYGAGLRLLRLSGAVGAALLCLAVVDLLVTAALSAWRHRRFDLEQAMSHAEVAEERRAEEGAGATKNEVAARRAGRG